MPKNEEGESVDLTIGNKQLLSIVFILFVLFGVVFSMGYFVGRASSGSETPPAKPVEASAPAQPRPDAAGARADAAAQAETPLQPGEGRVTEAATPVQAPPPAAATPEEPKSAPPAAALAKPLTAAAPASAPSSGQVFLQVAAVKRDQAQMLIDVLNDKGYHTMMVPVTVEGQQLYRTLVGPLKDASEVTKTKADLEGAGFKPILKKF
jgi:cell division septation protein DedD